jgi:hypothetical protein
MIPYFVLLFLVVLLSFFGITSRLNIYLVLIFVILAFFSGYRYNVGVDYPNYVNIFNGAKGYTAREPGFGYFIDLLHLIGGTYQLMFLVLSVIMQFLVYKIIKYYSPNVWVSVLIYLCVAPFYLATFNGTRQYIAVAIFLYSLRFIDNKKYIIYVLINGLGIFMFHGSLLFIAPLFLLIRNKLSLKSKLLIMCVAIGFNYLLEILLSYTPYMFYFDIEKEVRVSLATKILVLLLLPVVLFQEKIKLAKHKTVLFNLLFFCFLTLTLVFLQNKDILIQMFMRVNSYFFFVFIVFVPAIIHNLQNKNVRIMAYAGLAVCLSAYFFSIILYNGEQSALVPYQFNFKLFE